MTKRTHPNYPGWEIVDNPKNKDAPTGDLRGVIYYNGVKVGYWNDYKGFTKKAVSASDHPQAVEKVQAFFNAVISVERYLRELETQKRDAEYKNKQECEAAQAERALGIHHV